jgi:hypothetical protein
VSKGLTRKFEGRERREDRLSLAIGELKFFDWLRIETLILKIWF